VKRQLVGVADPLLVPLVAEALLELGHIRALVVHGEAGLDELSPLGPTRVAEVNGGAMSERTVRPEDFGLVDCAAEELAGGEPEDNAEIILRVLRGKERKGARSAVVLNAGAALHVAGLAETLGEGVERAVQALEAGHALEALERLREATNTS
jgi:anthranilate phosphoribosyltransferase